MGHVRLCFCILLRPRASPTFAAPIECFRLPKSLSAFCLGIPLLKLVNRLLHVHNITGQLAFGPVITEELNLAEANFGVQFRSRSGRIIGAKACFRGESNRNALDAFQMAKVRRQIVEANCDIDRRRTVDAWRLYDEQIMKRGRLDSCEFYYRPNPQVVLHPHTQQPTTF
jgi:hypothetical protein